MLLPYPGVVVVGDGVAPPARGGAPGGRAGPGEAPGPGAELSPLSDSLVGMLNS